MTRKSANRRPHFGTNYWPTRSSLACNFLAWHPLSRLMNLAPVARQLPDKIEHASRRDHRILITAPTIYPTFRLNIFAAKLYIDATIPHQRSHRQIGTIKRDNEILSKFLRIKTIDWVTINLNPFWKI